MRRGMPSSRRVASVPQTPERSGADHGPGSRGRRRSTERHAAPSRSPARTNRPSPTTNARWSAVGPGVATTRSGTSPVDDVAIGQRLGRYGSRAARTGDARRGPRTSRPGPPRRPRGPGRPWSGRRPRSGRRVRRRARWPGRAPGPVGSPGSTSDERRSPDEVGMDRLPGHPAAGGHRDPGHLGSMTSTAPRPAPPGAAWRRGSRRSTSRAPAAGAWPRSAATCRSRRPPSRRGPRGACARRAPRPPRR